MHRCNIMHAEDMRATPHASDQASHGTRVSGVWIWKVQDISNNSLSRDGKQHGRLGTPD